MRRMIVAMCVFLIALPLGASAQTRQRELGDVNWLRDLDEALSLSADRSKPVFVLFQEVPGCSTCVSYGDLVLSHPLVVEAIETLFVPLAVFNNHPGKDLAAMKLFNEPRWNNPVVRIVDSRRRDLTRRLAGDYSIAGTTGAMIDGLERENETVPPYLRLVFDEGGALHKVRKSGYSALSRSPYLYLPLTPLQAKRIERALTKGDDPSVYLSPRQRSMLAYVETHPEIASLRVEDWDFARAWDELNKRVENSLY